MARTMNATAKRLLTRLSGTLDVRLEPLAAAMATDAVAEDVASMGEDTFAQAVHLADAALGDRLPGQPLVRTEATGENGHVIVIVNDDMPFLFDSVLGEINAHCPHIGFLVHPIIDVANSGPNYEILDKSRPGLAREETVRTSVICAIVSGLEAGAVQKLESAILSTLTQVAAAVHGWQPMRERIAACLDELETGVLPARKSDVEEALAFLRWLSEDNFTFLGMRDYDYVGGEKRGKLQRAEGPALGILRDPDIRVMRRGDEPVTTTEEIRAFLNSRDLLIVSKANLKSVVHRRAYMDYIGVKRYDAKGQLAGELRIVGLFTSSAYTRSVLQIPYLRAKIETVIKRSDFEPGSHSAKTLLNVLESYPRDEAFQTDAGTLARHAEAISALVDRPRVRVLSRIDAFDRFVSIIVFVPRDRYSSQVRERICAYFATAYEGHVSAWYPAFPEGGLVRVHVIIGRRSGKTPIPTQASLERGVQSIIRTWDDELADAVNRSAAAVNTTEWNFPETYRDTVAPDQALLDIGYLARITPQTPIDVDFHRRDTLPAHGAALRMYHASAPVPLSERVPVLENMGFRVISEQTYRIGHVGALPEGHADCIWLHDMLIESADGKPVPMQDEGVVFEDGFLGVWAGRANNDGYNALILAAGMPARNVKVLRAYGRYLRQTGLAYSHDYMAQTLVRHATLARQLFELFDIRLNPARHANPEEDMAVSEKHLLAALRDSLAEVASIDEDRILRRFVNVITATLRTNFYQRESDGSERVTLAFKLNSAAIDDLPAPRPWREIFVFGTEVEGVHLRFGPIARGGLRWSDRAEDYRTEVLGLVKAQQVKNAVIVPVGAKGGFFPKRLPTDGGRDAVLAAGKAAYVTFVTALLSVTDNLDGETVVPPLQTVRHDGDDPYLVVAADKGTATFSDTANGLAQDHGFWLDDAFASGGSAGYDHKKMGITARGAWEAVKRHFREIDKDIQAEPFTVAGVGDMSGDVFGNGMLLSPKIRLIAAFDHRDIFIDPDPDTEVSFAERKRLFDLGRSSWADYDASKLSPGGGVFSRSQKQISLPKAAADAIGLDKVKASPTEIMRAILKADVELMWFGGIGTYVRASTETDAEVGDRANDAVRITARDLRAKVIGEGANLGVTQRARIEYGLAGGRCNSDAIDNSAGVNSSDIEVNIKIALAPSMMDGTLPRPKRDKLLADMTDNVAALVLRNNYEQPLTITRTHRKKDANFALQARLMESLEDRGVLDRKVEMLPDDEMLAERKMSGAGLARAEIGVLLSYAKIVLFDDLVRSQLSDDPWLERDLFSYFPVRMHKDFAANIRGHRLRREIISTVLANQTVNRGGPSVISRFEDATGMLPSGIVRAHVIVRDALETEAIHAAIDALDNKVSGGRQMDLYDDLAAATRTAIGQYLKFGDMTAPLGQAVGALTEARIRLEPKLAALLPDYLAEWVRARREAYKADGMADAVARRMSMLPLTAMTPDILAVSRATGHDIIVAGQAWFDVTRAFSIGRLEHLAQNLSAHDYFDGLAQTRALDMIHAARLQITRTALVAGGDDAADAVDRWIKANVTRITRVQERIAEMTGHGDLTVSRLTVAAGLLADLSSQA